MSIPVEGDLPAGSTAKDIILAIIGKIGTGGGIGSIIEYRGSAIQALSMEGRMTDLQHVDRGGRQGRHDRARRHDLRLRRGQATRAQGRRRGNAALDDWRSLPTDDGATFDHEVELDAHADCPARFLGHQSRSGHLDRERCPEPGDNVPIPKSAGGGRAGR